MTKRLLLLAALLPLPALAQTGFGPIRWDYVEASLAVPDIEEIGIEVEGSTAVTDKLVVFGTYRDFEADPGIDRKTTSIGVGRRWNVRPNMDLMASASFAENEIDLPGPNLDEDGVVIGGHIRGWVSPRLELGGAALLDNSIGSSTDTVVEFRAVFSAYRNLSYSGRIRVDEDESSLFIGARFYFGASRR